MRDDIRTTIRADRLCLYSQPILDLGLHTITRHEILLRVLHGPTIALTPAPFLAAAERTGEIVGVDKWVVRQAMAQLGEGPQTAHYQINLSGRTLSVPGLADFVLAAMNEHGVDPGRITFEITESVAIDNLTAAADFATRVRTAGCGLALDDFGTGHSALIVLKQLPIDLVKIDGQFITGLAGSPFNRIAVRSTVDMCRALGIRTAAEFVEDAETIGVLREMGVDFAQGFAIARPVQMTPAARLPQFLERPRPARATG